MKKILLTILAVTALFAACATPKPPSFTLPDSNGALWSTENFEGRPLLLVAMGTHCGYCKRSIPALNELSKKYAGQVEIVGLLVNNDLATAQKYAQENGAEFTILFNAGSLFNEMNVEAVPGYYFMNKKHFAAAKLRGYREPEEVEKFIKKII